MGEHAPPPDCLLERRAGGSADVDVAVKQRDGDEHG